MTRSKHRLNVQGLSRADKKLMECMVPFPGYVFVSIDLSSGEPTVTGEFSKDINYLYATVTGVGKAPFYKNGVLMIDDIYLMVASVSPLGAELIRKTFDTVKFEGRTFAEQWLIDPEVVKKHLKATRTFHKLMCLAIAYGVGPQKLVTIAYEKGFLLDLKTARQFRKAYWELFSGVRKFADRLALEIETKGYFVNPFGYRLTPDTRKAYNYMCQSTVSGIMHIFGMKLFGVCPWAEFVVCVHDEIIAAVPEYRVDEFKQLKELATDSLNEDIGWETPVRTGFVVGKNLYEAK